MLGHLRFLLILGLCVLTGFASAADRDRLTAFINTIGYDVMLESMGQAAKSAPRILGAPEGAFGPAWEKAATEAFDRDGLVDEALDFLEPNLTEELLNHAVDFYASPLGLRLVEAENTAHMQDNDGVDDEGRRLVAEMVADGSDRPALLQRMSDAVGGEETAVRSAIELQVRFLTAADAAGAINLRIDTEELRAQLENQSDEMRQSIREASLAANAYTYRDFSDDEVLAYVEALEHPDMQLVYQLLQAVQFELRAARYERLAAILAGLAPGREL